MKKFLKSIIYVFAFALLLLSGIFSCSAINKTSAATTETAKTVNFYGSDNETVIYSLDVPYGETLTSFTAVNPNSSLINNTNTNFWQGRQLIFDYYALTTASSFVSVDDNGFVTFGADTTGTGYLINILDFYKFAGKTCSATINYNNNKNLSLSVTFPTIHDGVTKSLARSGFNSDNIQIQLSKYAPSFGLDAYFCVQIDCLSGNSILINYIKVEFGSSPTPYFNSDYVNKLYTNSGGVISSSFEWSESKTSSSRFTFDTPITSDINLYGYNFSGQTFNYNGELSSDFGNISNYAIKDIEFFEVSGTYLYHMVFDTDLLDSPMTLFKVPAFNGVSLSTICDSVVVNSSNPDRYFNMFIYSERVATQGSGGGFVGALLLDSSSTYNSTSIVFQPGYGKVHIWLSLLQFNPTSRTTFDLVNNVDYVYQHRFFDNLSYIVDMKSDTNYSFELSPYHIEFSSNTLNYKILDYFLYNFDSNYEYSVSFGSYTYNQFSFSYNLINSGFINFSTVFFAGQDGLFFQIIPKYTNVDNFVLFNIVDCFFFVHRPVQRVDNTLVIYNFDYYNALYSINGISYQLQADGNLYNVNYVGSVPNDYFIYISNSEVANTIFEEYVHVYLSFDNNNIILNRVSDNVYSCAFGFDFNFTYYVQPLVSNSGVYSYTFNKPDYVSMLTTSPPYFDILAVAENILIFFMFYCPVVSDLISLLHFDLFFGALINIFDIVIQSGIGDFVLSCFAFLIFWSILKTLFPSLISSSSGWSNNYIMDEIQDTASFVSEQNKKRNYNKNHKLKPYKHKSGLKSKSRNRYNNLRSLTSDKSKAYRRKYVNNFKFDDIDDVEI